MFCFYLSIYIHVLHFLTFYLLCLPICFFFFYTYYSIYLLVVLYILLCLFTCCSLHFALFSHCVVYLLIGLFIVLFVWLCSSLSLHFKKKKIFLPFFVVVFSLKKATTTSMINLCIPN